MTTATLPSRTQANVSYTVSLHDNGASSCTCPAGAHGKACWHIKAVKIAAADATERRAAEAASLDMLFNSDNHIIDEMAAERRNAAALAVLNAQIDVMTRQIERHGHLMPSAMFKTLQKRYWTARERRSELTGIPLVSVA